MKDELVLFQIIFAFIIIAILGLVFGCVVGHTFAVRHNTDALCKQIKTETNEYFACKQKDFSEVIKEIISEVEE